MQAQQTASFSLNQAIEYALQHNSTVLNAQLDEQIYKRSVQEYQGIGLPQINAGANGQYFIDVPTSLLPNFIEGPVYGILYQNGLVSSIPPQSNSRFPVQFGTKYTLSGSIDASQLIFDGQFFVGLQAQRAVLALTGKNVTRTKIEITVAVSKAYYGSLLAKKQMELLQSNVARLKKVHDDTKALYENGFVEKLDYDRITVTYNNLLTEQEKVERMVNLSLMALKFQMGMDVNNPIELSDSIKEDEFENVLQSGTINPQARIEYQIVQSQIRIYQLDKKRYTFGYLPNLVAFGSYGYQALGDTFNFFKKPYYGNINGTYQKIDRWFPTTVVGMKLSLPIFDGLQKQRKWQQASLNLQKTENDLMNLTNAINLEANSSKITLTNATLTLNNQKKNMELAESVYNTAKIKYDQGVGSSLELLNAQTDLKTAQTNYLTALYDATVAKIDYQKSIGLIKP
jgi:outer membrane protein TolC